MEIGREILDEIVRTAKAEAPIEACGLLLGKGDVVTENYAMENIDHSEEHFTLDPKAQFAAMRYAREKGLRIVANWHSHPASPSRPSEEDLRLAADPTIEYVIVSLLDGVVNVNSFKIKDKAVVEKQVLVEGES
ncbi:MAG: M67 family metallopeptidase [Bacteroidales bacterium]|jgi:proteasome lid subunit RPN8/RPN11|nr:M67 family metallopeptidase [Bacteroidales bacterium]